MYQFEATINLFSGNCRQWVVITNITWHRLNHNISSGIRYSLKNRRDGLHWEDLVGYTLKDLIVNLEQKFTKEMSWLNYGDYWHIDHIKPIAWFTFNSYNDSEFKQCWSLNNLQPLYKIKNSVKSARYIG